MHVMLNRPESAERHGAGHVARCTVERLMADLGLRGVRRARSPRTTRSAPREQCPADLVKRHFSAFRPNELWVADITYVRTFSGWVYVAFVTDVFSRRIVGWQTSTGLYTDLALDALQMAVWQRKRAGADRRAWCTTCDRGVQYRSIRYGQALADCEAVASVGSKGDSFRLCPGRGAQLAVQGRAHPLAKDPGRTSTPPVVATAEWVHWYGHHPATLRHRDAKPRRARSRLGRRRQPEQPGTTTNSHHHIQINQPPQNPGPDKQ